MKPAHIFLQLLLLTILFSCGGSAPAPDEQQTSDTVETATANDLPAEGADDPVPAKSYAEQLEQFIPKGYSILDTASGNLNLDTYPDMILVLKKDNEEQTSDVIDHPEKRPLLVLTGDASGTLKQAARSDNTVYCVDCGGVFGDPYDGIVIKNGYFSVQHYGGSNWRWTRIITYKYNKSDRQWYLHKDGGESFHTSEPENVTEKIRTTKDFGKVKLGEFDIFEEEGQ